jgi:1,4-alpha-glucan branching enzyme
MRVFSLVLHTHLPYVRRNGVWPCGEDFFHQAATESYLPLLGALERIADRGLGEFLTVAMTPLVAHQMQDPHMLRELELYLGRYEPRALRQIANYRGVHAEAVHDLAAHYALFARTQLARLAGLGDGIAGGYAALERSGAIEILGGPASHAYLPLIAEPAILRAQVEAGVAEHRRVFGREPRGMWLPECGYAPERGIEEALLGAGVAYTVVDGPVMVRAAGGGATFVPRRLGGSRLVALARNAEVSSRVWSPTGGYPAGAWYRDFHHYDMEAGFKNWRVTSAGAPLELKGPYDPVRALDEARSDADLFVRALEAAFEERDGLVVACFDTELLGHWWFEGPAWLEEVYARLAGHPTIRPMSIAGALEAVPPQGAADLGAGSWGPGGDERSWVSPETSEMWRTLAEDSSETLRLVEKVGEGPALDQVVRELFLMQSSDWPHMVVAGRNPGYARERFEGHHRRWSELAELVVDSSPIAARRAAEIFEIDNAFPGLRARTLAGR